MTLQLTPIGQGSLSPYQTTNFQATQQIGASVPSTTRKCSVYLGAEAKFAHEALRVTNCFKNSHISSQDGNPAEATHYFLFITDSFLKSKEHMLPLIFALADPYFK